MNRKLGAWASFVSVDRGLASMGRGGLGGEGRIPGWYIGVLGRLSLVPHAGLGQLPNWLTVPAPRGHPNR